jgi:ATP-dependent Clp protease adaptor protein ClpS
MAIEKLNSAASEAQPSVINMADGERLALLYPGTPLLRTNPSTADRTGSSRPMMGQVVRQVVGGVAVMPARVKAELQLRNPYPNYKVVVLDDDINTFQHVVECLVRYIPGMQVDKAWDLAHQIDSEGSAVVWCGPQEQAELYHQQLAAQGLTMAPLAQG